jgi:uncharacterized protein (TIGR03435 family)
MKKLALWLLAAAPLLAQNIVGTWQGTLATPQGQSLRLVLKVSRADNESLKAVLYSIDQQSPPINASAATLQGSSFKVTIPAIGGGYEGKFEGDTITGTWNQGAGTPLNLARATPGTEWAIPEPPPPPKLMPKDANPTFEVSTIKPSKPDSPGKSILVGRGGANLFTTTNTTVYELIAFAYGVHPRQIAGGPSWIDADKWDISAKPDQSGMPSVTQLSKMVQKLLEDRYQLTFHREKKELSVYAIMVAKSGSKLAKSEAQGNLPGFGGPPGNIGARNTTLEEFAGFLQARVLDRPVVDQTGLSGRFDLQLKYAPDAAQQAQAGPGAPAPAPAVNTDLPDLFAAFQQQLGLKLESTKAQVDVMVIDKLTKPSEN